MAGRRIKVMMVVDINEDCNPTLFEYARCSTIVDMDNVLGALLQYAEKWGAKVKAVEHSYER